MSSEDAGVSPGPSPFFVWPDRSDRVHEGHLARASFVSATSFSEVGGWAKMLSSLEPRDHLIVSPSTRRMTSWATRSE